MAARHQVQDEMENPWVFACFLGFLLTITSLRLDYLHTVSKAMLVEQARLTTRAKRVSSRARVLPMALLNCVYEI